MQARGRRISKGRRGHDPLPHSVEIVDTFLLLTDGFKDELVCEHAGLSPSYLSNIRSYHTRDPGIGKIQRMLEYMGYKLIIIKENSK